MLYRDDKQTQGHGSTVCVPTDSWFIYLGEPVRSQIPESLVKEKLNPQALWFDDRVIYASRIELWTWFRFAGRPAEEDHG